MPRRTLLFTTCGLLRATHISLVLLCFANNDFVLEEYIIILEYLHKNSTIIADVSVYLPLQAYRRERIGNRPFLRPLVRINRAHSSTSVHGYGTMERAAMFGS